MDYLRRLGSTMWHASGASSVYQGGQQLIGNVQTGGTWSGMARGAARMALGGAALYTLPSSPLRALAWSTASHLASSETQTLARETVGPVVKRAGKYLDNQRLIEQGRHLQYGHLSPERLFREHPSAFLRQYAIQSHIQAADRPGGRSDYHTQFQLRTITPATSAFPSYDRITDSSNVHRRPRAHLHLIRSSDAIGHQQRNHSVQVGRDFHAAFLPMLQATNDTLTAPRQRGPGISERTVPGFNQGRIREPSMRRRGETVTLTTQLSGCSITRHRNALLHIRPSQDGATLQRSIRSPRFGRQDYGPGNQAFVMLRRKSNGRVKLYYQVHDSNTNHIRSGSRYV